jgi:hypothetical protein
MPMEALAVILSADGVEERSGAPLEGEASCLWSCGAATTYLRRAPSLERG